MSNRTFVIGVGMTKFDKPGAKEGDYPDWAREAGSKALEDAGIAYDLVEQAYVGYCYGESTSPPLTAWRARNSALEPVEQLLLTLTTGMPVRPRP